MPVVQNKIDLLLKKLGPVKLGICLLVVFILIGIFIIPGIFEYQAISQEATRNRMVSVEESE